MSDERPIDQTGKHPAPDGRGDANAAAAAAAARLGFWAWFRETARLWGFLAFVLLVLVVFRQVVLPFVLAVLVTYVLSPVLSFLGRWKIGGRALPRFAWLIVLYLVLLGLAVLFFTSFVPRVSQDLRRLVREAPAIWEKAKTEYVPRVAGWLQANLEGDLLGGPAVARPPEEHGPSSRISVKRLPDGTVELDVRQMRLEVSRLEDGRWVVGPGEVRRPPSLGAGRFEDAINRFIQESVRDSESRMNRVLRFGQRAVVGLLHAITTFILVLMISAFLLLDTARILGGIRGLAPKKYHHDFDEVLARINRGLSGAIRGQLLICVVNAVLTWIGLKVFGVKYSFLLALLAGTMSLIPIFGSILSSIPIVVVALVSGKEGVDLPRGFLILSWIIGIHLLEANVLNPKIIGSAAKIHPVIVIFAVVAGERTYGPMGALLAVPIVSAIQATFVYIRAKVRGEEVSVPQAQAPSKE
ncbi:MAG: AI-2E family transporter [Deltaproteobacteria bacterium]|nr:AI-2E family transporter [Deltaproteobacteria bacterium]